MGKILILLLFLVSFSGLAKGETVILKTGKVIEGRITERTLEYIKVDIGGITIKYYLEGVVSIDGEEIARNRSETTQSPLTSEGAISKERIRSQTWMEHYALAEEHLERRQYKQAIDEFNKVIEEDLRAYEAYTGIGFAYIQQGKYEEAIKSFEKATEINPDYAPAYDNIGVVYSLLRRYREAIPYFEKAVHIDSEFVASYNNLASTHVYLGQHHQAVIYYQKAFQVDPTNADSAYHLGVVHFDLGKTKEAKDYLEKAKELYQAQGDYYGFQRAEGQLKMIPQTLEK